MKKLSLKIQLSYFVYAILFYTVAIVNHNLFQPKSSDLKSSFKNVFDAIEYWCTANFLFLCTLFVSSLVGVLYCYYQKKKTFKSFAFICIASGLLLIYLFAFC